MSRVSKNSTLLAHIVQAVRIVINHFWVADIIAPLIRFQLMARTVRNIPVSNQPFDLNQVMILVSAQDINFICSSNQSNCVRAHSTNARTFLPPTLRFANSFTV
jgi:hypothetical protein